MCFNPKKLFLSSRRYDPGGSSRILIFTHPGSRIGSRGQKDTGSRIRIRNTDFYCYMFPIFAFPLQFVLCRHGFLSDCVHENTVHSDVPGNRPDVERPFAAWGSSSGRGLGPAHHAAYLACVRGLPLPQEEDNRQEQEEEEREGEIERDATTHQRSTAVSEIGKMTSDFENDENYFRGFLH